MYCISITVSAKNRMVDENIDALETLSSMREVRIDLNHYWNVGISSLHVY